MLDQYPIVSGLITMGAQLTIIIVISVLLAVLSGWILRRCGRLSSNQAFTDNVDQLRRSLRQALTLLCIVLSLGLAAWNGWLVYQGIDPLQQMIDWLRQVKPELWLSLGKGLGLSLLYVLAAIIINRGVLRFIAAIENKIKSLGQIQSNDEAIARFFRGLQRALRNAVWLGVLILTCMNLNLPDGLLWFLLRFTTIYLIIAVGLTIIRITAVLVDTLNGISARYAENKAWSNYYLQLRPLVPLLRRCLEYALWIAVATLALAQLPALSSLAKHGPSLIQAIGLFFLARVAIELTYLIIDQVMLGDQGMEDAERKRRRTIVPLIKTVSKQVIYFAAFVLVLGSLGFDPMPFLAGAGILGVVIGLGAQPLINDVVSGFFVLFENTFLVGDTIRAGNTYGCVEAIDFRTTRIRDFDGNVHVLRNGDLRHVINYSKDFTYAVLELAVPHHAAIDQALSLIEGCADTVKDDPRVRGPLQIRGITKINEGGVHLRAVMAVAPGEHFPIAAQLRQAAVSAFQAAGIALMPHQHLNIERRHAEPGAGHSTQQSDEAENDSGTQTA